MSVCSVIILNDPSFLWNHIIVDFSVSTVSTASQTVIFHLSTCACTCVFLYFSVHAQKQQHTNIPTATNRQHAATNNKEHANDHHFDAATNHMAVFYRR